MVAAQRVDNHTLLLHQAPLCRIRASAVQVGLCLEASMATHKTHLVRYSNRFEAVEISSSFNHLHRRATYERWAATVGPTLSQFLRSLDTKNQKYDVTRRRRRALPQIERVSMTRIHRSSRTQSDRLCKRRFLHCEFHPYFASVQWPNHVGIVLIRSRKRCEATVCDGMVKVA